MTKCPIRESTTPNIPFKYTYHLAYQHIKGIESTKIYASTNNALLYHSFSALLQWKLYQFNFRIHQNITRQIKTREVFLITMAVYIRTREYYYSTIKESSHSMSENIMIIKTSLSAWVLLKDLSLSQMTLLLCNILYLTNLHPHRHPNPHLLSHQKHPKNHYLPHNPYLLTWQNQSQFDKYYLLCPNHNLLYIYQQYAPV